MFRKTFTGSLVAASLAAGALMTMPSASATPTWVDPANISGTGVLPTSAQVAMSENGKAAATWVRSVAGEDRIQASYFTGGANGTWTFPDTVSDAGRVVSKPTVAMNAQGEAVLAWLQVDNSDETRIAVSRYAGSGNFDGWTLITKANDLNATAPLSAGLDSAGKLFVARRDTDGAAINRVRVSTFTEASSIGNFTFSDDSAYAPDIAVNERGDALLAYRDQQVGPDRISARRFAAANSSWSVLNAVGSPATYSANEVETALSDNGAGTIAYSRQDTEGQYRATANKVSDTGFVSPLNTVSPADATAGGLSLSQNDSGTALLSWNATGGGNRIRFATRPQTSGWSTSTLVPGALGDFSATSSAISDSGTVFVGFADDDQQRAAYRVTPASLLKTFSSGAIGFVEGETSVGIDDQGNALLGGIIKPANPAISFVHGAFLDVAGPKASVASLPANKLKTTFGVNWSATDRFSEVGTGSLRVRTAHWNGGFATTYPFVNTADHSLAFVGAPGNTYCLSALARDEHANIGAYSSEKCTTTPVDDRALVTAKGFKRAKAGSSYLGTYSVATKKNAVMSLQHVKAKRLALVVTKVANGGKVQVTFAGKSYGTYSLKGSGNKKIIAIKGLNSMKSGILRIKVTSSTGKVVRIDGVIAAK